MTVRLIEVWWIAVAALACASASPTWAGENKRQLTIQLNKLEVTANACRMTLVLSNQLGTEIKQASFVIVLFDKGESVARLLTVNPGRLPANKTRVKQFDIKGLACGDVGRVLLNDVKRCAGEGLTPANCLDAVRPSSRIDIPFIN